MNENIVLQVQDLEVNFYNNERCNKVLRGVSFNLEKGKIMCIVGESGCGKSVTANSIMGLLPDLSRIEKGEIHFYNEGKDIRIDKLKRKGKEMREIRGSGISMIFQDPMTALNPVFTVGYQINEALLYHDMAKNKHEAKEMAINLLKDMGIIVESGDAEAVLTRSAHPYTKALIKSIPVLGRGKKQDLQPIKGSTPDPYHRPKGCQFAPRCEFATEQCKEEMPPEIQLEPGHYCRCFHSTEGKVGE